MSIDPTASATPATTTAASATPATTTAASAATAASTAATAASTAATTTTTTSSSVATAASAPTPTAELVAIGHKRLSGDNSVRQSMRERFGVSAIVLLCGLTTPRTPVYGAAWIARVSTDGSTAAVDNPFCSNRSLGSFVFSGGTVLAPTDLITLSDKIRQGSTSLTYWFDYTWSDTIARGSKTNLSGFPVTMPGNDSCAVYPFPIFTTSIQNAITTLGGTDPLNFYTLTVCAGDSGWETYKCQDFTFSTCGNGTCDAGERVV